ncbi:MAG: TRAP transporter substrate-binding protein [Clostridiales Family XIII bacterium]|jgi:TRAP-type C4-dicarboxylate transport system substrate-binding protein|nr:TRAP transporter substrate-binding protein [Clostridiales Family XIII bacterium]
MEKERRRILISVLLAVLLLFVLSGCGGSSNSGSASDSGGADVGESDAVAADTGEIYTVRMGCATVLPSHPNQFMEEFKAAIEAKTDRFAVELYPANQLGSNVQMIQGLQNGTVQCVVLPVGFFTPIAPIMNVLDLPSLVPDSEMQYRMLNESEVGNAFRTEISKAGMTPLSYLWCVEKEMMLNKPVNSLSDMKGLKIRCFDSSVAQNEIVAYGASPVSMSTGDLAMALQQGAIDGVLADVTLYDPMKLYEKAPYLIKAPMNPLSNVVMFSNELLDKLPADLAQILEETVVECRESVYDYTQDYIQDCYDDMQANGCTFVEPSEEFKNEIDSAVVEVHEKLKNEMPDAIPLYDMVVAYVAENAG